MRTISGSVPVSSVIANRDGLHEDVVALTFDDGPSECTVPILETLRDVGVPATFFIVGDAIAGREPTLQQMVEDGHEIGNHSLRHPKLHTLRRKDVQDELTLTSARIRETVGAAPTVFRPPYFGYNRTVLEVAAACGFSQTVCASVYTNDWELESGEAIAAAVIPQVRAGSIIDLHDGRPPHDPPHAAGFSRDDRWPTVQAVKLIVPALIARGFRFVTVSELLAL